MLPFISSYLVSPPPNGRASLARPGGGWAGDHKPPNRTGAWPGGQAPVQLTKISLKDSIQLISDERYHIFNEKQHILFLQLAPQTSKFIKNIGIRTIKPLCLTSPPVTLIPADNNKNTYKIIIHTSVTASHEQTMLIEN